MWAMLFYVVIRGGHSIYLIIQFQLGDHFALQYLTFEYKQNGVLLTSSTFDPEESQESLSDVGR